MGDHRANIKIEMEFHGIKDSCDMWINYWPEGEYDEVDDRIIEFVRKVYALGMLEYKKNLLEVDKKDTNTEKLKRIKDKVDEELKYETSSSLENIKKFMDVL